MDTLDQLIVTEFEPTILPAEFEWGPIGDNHLGAWNFANRIERDHGFDHQETLRRIFNRYAPAPAAPPPANPYTTDQEVRFAIVCLKKHGRYVYEGSENQCNEILARLEMTIREAWKQKQGVGNE